MLKGGQSEAPAQGLIDPAIGQGGQKRRVLLRAGEHRHIGMVLGGGAHHRRAADIDGLDRRIEGHGGIGHGLAERIEVHHHHIDQRDRLGLQISLMGWVVAPGQDAAVDARVQRLHTAAQDLGSAGVVRHPGHRQPGRLQRRSRAATGEQVIARLQQPLGKRHQTVLLGHAQEGRGRHGSRSWG